MDDIIHSAHRIVVRVKSVAILQVLRAESGIQ